MEDPHSSLPIPESTLRRWAHDVQGPVTNVQAFSEELSTALQDISSIITPILSQCSPQERQAIEQLLDDDVEPCLKLLAQSVSQMQARVDNVAKDMRQLMEDAGGKR